MNSKLLVGSVVYGSAGIGCKVLKIEGPDPIVQTLNGIRKIAFSRIVKVEAPTSFWIGDLVTLQDKYMYRAGDVGIVESIDSQSIQIRWGTTPQPQLHWRILQSEQLELIDRRSY